MGIEYSDWAKLQRKNAKPKEPAIVKTIEPTEAWGAMEAYLKDKVTATKKAREDILHTYMNSDIFSYEQMIKSKCLLDITSGQLLCYEQILDTMKTYHPSRD